MNCRRYKLVETYGILMGWVCLAKPCMRYALSLARVLAGKSATSALFRYQVLWIMCYFLCNCTAAGLPKVMNMCRTRGEVGAQPQNKSWRAFPDPGYSSTFSQVGFPRSEVIPPAAFSPPTGFRAFAWGRETLLELFRPISLHPSRRVIHCL